MAVSYQTLEAIAVKITEAFSKINEEEIEFKNGYSAAYEKGFPKKWVFSTGWGEYKDSEPAGVNAVRLLNAKRLKVVLGETQLQVHVNNQGPIEFYTKDDLSYAFSLIESLVTQMINDVKIPE